MKRTSVGVAHLAILDRIPCFLEERGCLLQDIAIAARSVGDWELVGAIQDRWFDSILDRAEKLQLAFVRRHPETRQIRVLPETLSADISVREEVLVRPFEIEDQRQPLAKLRVGKDRPPGVEDEAEHAARQLGFERILEDVA